MLDILFLQTFSKQAITLLVTKDLFIYDTHANILKMKGLLSEEL